MKTFCILIIVCLLIGCKKSEIPIIKGCADPLSLTYDPNAKEDDGTCRYSKIIFHHDNIWQDSVISLQLDGYYVLFNVTDTPDCNDSTLNFIQLTDGDVHHWSAFKKVFYGMQLGWQYYWTNGTVKASSQECKIVGI